MPPSNTEPAQPPHESSRKCQPKDLNERLCLTDEEIEAIVAYRARALYIRHSINYVITEREERLVRALIRRPDRRKSLARFGGHDANADSLHMLMALEQRKFDATDSSLAGNALVDWLYANVALVEAVLGAVIAVIILVIFGFLFFLSS